MTKHFFEESKEQSRIKAKIVKKYFFAWAKVIISQLRRAGRARPKIAYIDLFAGPGRYKDGTQSTPLLILESAITDKDLCDALVTHFNDKSKETANSLIESIAEIKNIDKLRYAPEVLDGDVDDEYVKLFDKISLVPTLLFLDPWGYKGLSLKLIKSVLKDFGCECIFFFNYNRINMGVPNEIVEEHMIDLFGETRYENLRKRIENLDPVERELIIVEELTSALFELGGKFVLPFRFKNEKGTRTSHHLFFVSKNVLGYSIMKEVMAKESRESDSSVGTFEYNPATRNQPTLFGYHAPLEELGENILKKFRGESMSVRTVFEEDNIGTPFILSNYKTVLMELEERGVVKIDKPSGKRRKGTLGDKHIVTFPQ